MLDEIGNAAPKVQQALLRALSTRMIRPLGSDEDVPFDTRIIAATNAELLQDAQEGSFREDLYYRLAVITIRTPPLRRRKSDLPLLAVFFLTRAAESQGLPTPRLNARLARLLPQIVELGSISRQEYQDMSGKDISMRTAQYDLQILVRLGLVRREGRGPAQRYIVLPAARGFRA